MSIRRSSSLEQRLAVSYGMPVFILIVVMLQLWLVTATMNPYMGGDEAGIWPVVAASLFFLLLNVRLLRYLYFVERVRR